MNPSGITTLLGCPLHYDVTGDGPPVLLIQGVGIHGAGWRPQVEALSGEFRCLTFDNRGMARSQPIGDCALTIEQMADDAVRVMDAAGWESAHVVGHSMGGLIALQLALVHRARVRSLSLLCTFADGRIPNRLTSWMLWVGIRTRIGTRRARRRAFLQLVMPPDAYRAMTDSDAAAGELAPLFGHDVADHPPVTMKQLGAMKRYGDTTPRLGELKDLPTLVVSAEHDPIAPPSAGRAIAAGISGARYVELAGASHGMPIHQPARVNELLLDHLRQAEKASVALAAQAGL
jgi:pimeloyl-ACP methyl ester carboxylesterase